MGNSEFIFNSYKSLRPNDIQESSLKTWESLAGWSNILRELHQRQKFGLGTAVQCELGNTLHSLGKKQQKTQIFQSSTRVKLHIHFSNILFIMYSIHHMNKTHIRWWNSSYYDILWWNSSYYETCPCETSKNPLEFQIFVHLENHTNSQLL